MSADITIPVVLAQIAGFRGPAIVRRLPQGAFWGVGHDGQTAMGMYAHMEMCLLVMA